MSGAEGVPGWRRPPVGDRARRWEPGTVGRFGGEMGVHRRGPAALRDVVAVVVVVCPCRVRGGTGVFEEFHQGASLPARERGCGVRSRQNLVRHAAYAASFVRAAERFLDTTDAAGNIRCFSRVREIPCLCQWRLQWEWNQHATGNEQQTLRVRVGHVKPMCEAQGGNPNKARIFEQDELSET